MLLSLAVLYPDLSQTRTATRCGASDANHAPWGRREGRQEMLPGPGPSTDCLSPACGEEPGLLDFVTARILLPWVLKLGVVSYLTSYWVYLVSFVFDVCLLNDSLMWTKDIFSLQRAGMMVVESENLGLTPFFFFCLFRAAPMAYKSYQAKGQIRATAACRCHIHSNTGSVPCLQLTQLMATLDP